jgi:aminoglycoside 2''-phosphotransferase
MEPDWQKIECENAGLSVHSAYFLGEGWNARAYLVNNELIFRFPKRAEHWEELKREIAFLAFAADHLPLAVPRYVQVAPTSLAATHGYAVYRYLRGHALSVNVLTQEQLAAAADALAAFLRALHSLQPSPAVSALLPQEDERTVAEDCFAQAESEIAPKLSPTEAKALRAQFASYLDTPANFLFRPAVLHADLSSDHILAENGSVVAVIDFGDINWGDPDYDFTYLLISFGQEFVEEVARRYGHPNLEQLMMKLRYFAMVDQIGTILYGAGRALAGQEAAAWRRLRQLLNR